MKSGQSIERLVGYLKRNRDYIPCYTLRKQLGLRNSSVEQHFTTGSNSKLKFHQTSKKQHNIFL